MNITRDKLPLLLVLLAFVGTRAWMLCVYQAPVADTNLYATLARRGVDMNEVAYRDFNFPYPPLAWWLVQVPRLVDFTEYTSKAPTQEMKDEFFGWYYRWFHGILAAADVACLVLLFLLARRKSPTAAWALPAAYVVLTAGQFSWFFDRLDLGLLTLLLACFYCWTRSLAAERAAHGWATASYLFLGLGISFKIIPIVCVPFLLLADLWAWPGWLALAARLGALAAGACGPFLVQMQSSGSDAFSVFRYHSDRGLHLESTWSSLRLIAHGFGAPCKVVESHMALDLVGPWDHTWQSVASVGLLAALGSIGLWALARGERYDRRLALDAAWLALVDSVVLSSVFSPQYLIWALPIAMLLALDVFPPARWIWLLFGLLLALVVSISSWLYPDHFQDLAAMEDLSLKLVVIRSGCLVLLGVLLTGCFFRHFRLQPPLVAPAPVAALPTP